MSETKPLTLSEHRRREVTLQARVKELEGEVERLREAIGHALIYMDECLYKHAAEELDTALADEADS